MLKQENKQEKCDHVCLEESLQSGKSVKDILILYFMTSCRR